MRQWGPVLLVGLLAGCGGGGGGDDAPIAPPEALGGTPAQMQACAVAVASHAGLSLDAVRTEWTGPTDTGSDIVFVYHGDTLHTCEVDGAGQVLELQHPQE